jgi:hypothetical protein
MTFRSIGWMGWMMGLALAACGGDKSDAGDESAKSDKSDKSAKAGGSSSAKDKKAAKSEEATGCPEGAYKDVEGGYCIVVPADWKPGPAEDRGGIRTQRSFGTAPHDIRFNISTYKPGVKTYESEVARYEAWAKDEPGSEVGDIPGGRFLKLKMSETIKQAEVVVKTPKGPVTCYINTRAEVFEESFNVCKTLRAL